MIELLVVSAIIGLLATFSLAVIAHYRDKAKDSRIETVLAQVRNFAAMIYHDDNSYANICSGGTLNDSILSLRIIKEDAYKFTRLNPTCFASATSYCVQSSLVTSGYYCVDSTGVAVEIPNSYCSAGNKCTAP